MNPMSEITCTKCQEILAAALLDELPSEERAAYEAHIKSCLQCSKMQERYWTIDKLVREVQPDSFPPRLGKSFWKKVEQREKEENSQDIRRSQTGPDKPEAFVIGIGGTGKEVVRRLKREELRRNYYLPLFQYLVIDTESFDELPAMDPRMFLEDEECLYIGDYDANQILKDLSIDSPIGKWWGKNREKTELGRVEDGADQRRAVGRIGFFNSFEKIEARLRYGVQQFLDAINSSQPIDGHDKKVTDYSPTIYLVFSLCGGTGSGLFLDVAYVVRELLKFRINRPPTIIALAMLPGPYLQSINSLFQKRRLHANTYAALSELERLYNKALGLKDNLGGNHLWTVQYNAHLTIDSESLPFDYIYLVDDIDVCGRRNDRQWLFEQMSRAIFWLSDPAIATRFRERASNLNKRALERSVRADPFSKWRPPIYSGLGISTIEFDSVYEHLQLDLEYLHNKRTQKITTDPLLLPPYLHNEVALIEEMCREQEGISPFPFGNKPLRPVGGFRNWTDVRVMLENFFTKYKSALGSLSTSPIWLRRKEHYSISIQVAIAESVLEAATTYSATTIQQRSEQIQEYLRAFISLLNAKKQEKQCYKSLIEEGFVNKLLLREPAGTVLTKLYRNILNLLDALNSRDMTKHAESVADQLYQWYDASAKDIIYSDLVFSLLNPLIDFIKGEDPSDIERWLNIVLTYRPLLISMPHDVHTWFLFEHVYPNINTRNELQPTESLVERLLSPELSSKRQAFLERAECMWDFVYEGNEEMIPYVESINLLGYGIDAAKKLSLRTESGIRSLFGGQLFSPEVVAMYKPGELVFLKTMHGLTSSSIRSFQEMQQAYETLKTVRHDPYLHLLPEFYPKKVPTAPTPEKIIQAWKGTVEVLTDVQKRATQNAVNRYEQVSSDILQEEIVIDYPDHPFFDFVDSLQKIFDPESRTLCSLMVQKSLAEIEGILQDQGWDRIEPKVGDKFDPETHKKDEPSFDEENAQDEWASVTEQGRFLLDNMQRERPLYVIDVVRPGYKHKQTGRKRLALVIVNVELGSGHNPGHRSLG
jgi:hypothetical protein